MQKNKLNLHICGIYLLNPYKTVVSHLKANLQNRLLEVLMEEDDYVGIPFHALWLGDFRFGEMK